MYRFLCYILVLPFFFFFFSIDVHSQSSAVSPPGPINIPPPPPPKPPKLEASIDFTEPSGNNMLDAEETAHLNIEVSNEGEGPASGVTIKISKLEAPKGLVFDENVVVGDIGAGKNATKSLNIEANKEVESGKATFCIEISEKRGFDARAIELSFYVIAFTPPQIEIKLKKYDNDGDTLICQEETVKVVGRIQNNDSRMIKGVKCNLEIGQNVALMEGYQSSFDLGDMNPNEYKDIAFSFYPTIAIKKGQKIPITLAIETDRPSFIQKNDLGLEVDKEIPPHKAVIPPPPKKENVIDDSLVDVDRNIPKAKLTWINPIAFVIGNRNYRKLPDVIFAYNDAKIVREYLIRTLGVNEDNIVFRWDTTTADLESIFGTKDNLKCELHSRAKKKGSDVFIYYSGHGVPDSKGNPCLVPVDTNPDSLNRYVYPIDTLYQSLATAPIRNLMIVIDACFSGSSEGGPVVQKSDMIPELISPRKSLLEGKNALILTATNEMQIANWLNDGNHGLFTYCFLKALRGDADKDQDKKLTAQELKDYLDFEVRDLVVTYGKEEQEPLIEGKLDQVLVYY